MMHKKCLAHLTYPVHIWPLHLHPEQALTQCWFKGLPFSGRDQTGSHSKLMPMGGSEGRTAQCLLFSVALSSYFTMLFPNDPAPRVCGTPD